MSSHKKSTKQTSASAKSAESHKQHVGKLDSIHVSQADIDIHPGDHIAYKPIGSTASNTATSTGEVVSIVTEPAHVGKRHFNASESEPRVMIRNDHTHKTTGYKVDHVVGLAPAEEEAQEEE